MKQLKKSVTLLILLTSIGSWTFAQDKDRFIFDTMLNPKVIMQWDY